MSARYASGHVGAAPGMRFPAATVTDRNPAAPEPRRFGAAPRDLPLTHYGVPAPA
jgi:hypothetical protein